MNRLNPLRILAALFLIASGASTDLSASPQPTRTETVRTDVEFLGVSVPEWVQIDVHNDPVGLEWQPGDPIREIPRQHWDDPAAIDARSRPPVNPPAEGLDWLAELQQSYDREVGRQPVRALQPGINIEGAPGTTLPPDPSGDIGPNHYVQAINASGGTRVRVYDKTDGSLLANFILTTQLQGSGVCSSGLGDPIVIYDNLADRWVLTEFSPSNGRALCMYVSSSSDPTNTAPASWFRYTFVMPAFPDYPKYGVWSDGYYVGANESGTNGQRPMYVMERAQMLLGQPARFVRITAPTLAGFGFQLLTPAHHIGSTPPPAGAGGIFMRHVDDEAHFSGSNNPSADFLQLWQLSMNWVPVTPTGTLTGPVQIPITEFNSNLNGFTAFNAFPQPSGQRLDPLREPIMNQMVYRNFGTHEAILGNMVTNLATPPTIRGGIRWFELRRVGGTANPWTLHQEGTYGPADAGGNADRWMGASAMDSSGGIALAYSITRQSPGIFPSLRRVGRIAADPLGVMTAAETEIVTGERSQANERWGDYHQMGVDPADGCTFWFTGEYMGPAGTTNNTRVASFKHDECGEPTFTLSAAAGALDVCVAPTPSALAPVTVNISSVAGYNTPVNLVFNPALPQGLSGGFSPTSVVPAGTSTLSLNVANNVVPGPNTVVIEGTSGSIVKTQELSYFLSTQSPAQVLLSSPANGATNVATQPVLSWNATDQAASYTVEVSANASFAPVLFSGVVASGTSIAVTTTLATDTEYFWRVRAANTCGTGSNSPTFSFRTRPPAGECSVSQTQVPVFSQNFTAGAGGFTVSGSGASNWVLSTARPSPVSGGNAFRATDIATVSDQRLTSPTIALPADQLPINLRYQNYREIERNGTTACYDGGILEISVDGGAFAALPESAIRNDPYRGPVAAGFSNPLAGQRAWCDRTPARAWGDTLVDLSNWAGQDVQIRWRLGTDDSTGYEGWYLDDVRVDACASPNQAPVADPQSVNTAFQTPVGITLTGSDPDSDPITFNAPTAPTNGLLSGTAPNLTYTPNNGYSGPDSFTFTVSDASLTSTAATVTITVGAGPNQAPVVTAPIGNRSNAEGDAVNFSVAGNFSDPDVGDVLTLSTTSTLPDGVNFAAGVFSGNLSFVAEGSYPITVTATDGDGASVGDSFTWTVSNTNRAPVVAAPIGNRNNAEDDAVSFSVVANFSDPDVGDSLTLSTLSTLPDGITFVGGVFSGNLSFTAEGSYPVTVSATDGDGASVNDSFTWVVSNTNRSPVVAAPIGNRNNAEGDAVNFNVSANFSDPDAGDVLTLSTASSLPDGVNFAAGVFSGTLSFDAEGSYPVTVTATDVDGASINDSFTWMVSNLNRAPIAIDDDYAGSRNSTLNIAAPGVLANDSDPDADALSAVLVAGPANGNLGLNSNGSFGYTPDTDFCGSDAFTYRANDGGADSNIASVSIDVSCTNQSPTLVNPIGNRSNAEGDTVNLSVVANFSDPDAGDVLTLSTLSALPDGLSFVGGVFSGDLSFTAEGSYPITVTATDGDGASVNDSFTWTVTGTNQNPLLVDPIGNRSNAEGDTVNLSVVANFSDPDAGDVLTLSTVSALPDGLSFVGGVFSGDLSFIAEGSYPITVTATDGDGASVNDSFTWTVTGTNQDPLVLNPIGNRSNAEGDTVNLSVVANFSDPDAGDVLTLSTVSSLPDGLSFVGGVFAGDLSFSAEGSYPITVTATDGDGASVSDSFTWTVTGTNQDPLVLNPIGNRSNAEGDTVNLSVVANFSDPDAGDVLTLSTVSSLPDGLSFVGGVFAGDLSFSAEGSYPITVTATDGDGASVSDSFTWTVTGTNQAPVAGPLDASQAVELQAYSRDVSAAFSDPDGDDLVFSVDGLPASLDIDPVTGVVSGSPALGDLGDYTVTVRATDAGALFVEASFTLSIEPAAPVDGDIFRDSFEAIP